MAADVDTTAGAIGWENAPSHYQGAGGMENFDVWDAYEMDPYTANAFKYLARWDKKGSPLNDLKKAFHYIDERIKRWNDPGSGLSWLDWKPAKRDKHLTPETVADAFGLTSFVREATLHLLFFRTAMRSPNDLDAAKWYLQQAIDQLTSID